VTFKDLKKVVSLETTIIQQQSKLLEICKDNPFWIWDIEAHKLQDIKTTGNCCCCVNHIVCCCVNHIIGLPTKDQMEKPIYDYQKILHDSSLISEFSNPLNHSFKHRHLWVKKARGALDK
jgi:hypothetical protein